MKSLVPVKDCLWINLLTEKDEDLYGRDPDQLSHILSTRNYKIVVIDEIQKVPKLLDVVHHEMEKNKKIQFILTGSSTRKLKRGGANLLGGRAFSYHLYPFSIFELGDSVAYQIVPI